MMGTFDCIYETPCGWCSKWDKKCDNKIPERGHRAKISPIDDAMNDIKNGRGLKPLNQKDIHYE